MYKARLLKLDKFIEEKVTLEINSIVFVGFADVCPYHITENNIYSVDLGLTILDDYQIIELDVPQQRLERINKTFKYIVYGRIQNGSIDIGNDIKIEDELFEENTYLNGKYVKLQVDRISIAFI